MRWLINSFKELTNYPSAIAGLVLIGIMFVVAVVTPLIIPYDEAITLWRGGENVWQENPKNAAPIWTNLFTSENIPETIALDSVVEGEAVKVVEKVDDEKSEMTITYSFTYDYDDFPQDISVFFDVTSDEKDPHISMVWITPSGEEISVRNVDLVNSDVYRFKQDERLEKIMRGVDPSRGLFLSEEDAQIARRLVQIRRAEQTGAELPEFDDEVPLDLDKELLPVKGDYQLVVNIKTFETDSDVEAKLVLYGEVHGWAGTDHLRRDLGIALLWGTPIALAFGLLAAVGTSALTMFIAAFGVWFGGWVDALIQRITEVQLVLPFLSILIMVGTFYSRSIWLMLGVSILLSIFGAGIKTYRAIFLQVKESSYIEAARSYGASDGRIIFRYLIPRIIPLLIPQLVVAIPSFVFLEASLAVLGLGDPVIPTWGKIINEARTNGALFNGYYYWMLEPAVLLMVVGLGFAMLGFSLDRIFNPRLRGL